MTLRPYIALLCTALLHTPFVSAETTADTLVISEAWVREGPPTASVLAAYMRIDNPGATDQIITAVSSPRFERVEMHRTEVVEGVARMLPQEQLVVPAGGSITLEPGGLHLMLINPTLPVSAGESVTLRLQLTGDNCTSTTAVVKRDDTGGMEDHSHHHHH